MGVLISVSYWTKEQRGSAAEKSLADKAKHWRTGPQSYEDLKHSLCLWAVALGKNALLNCLLTMPDSKDENILEHDIPAR